MKFIGRTMLGIMMCVLLAVPLAHAEEGDMSSGRPAKHERMQKKIKEIYSRLNLSNAQKQQLEDNRKHNMEGMKEGRTQKRAYRDGIKAELMKPNMDMGVINDLQAKIKALDAQEMDDHLHSILEVRKILTPEQFAQFIDLMEKGKRERREQNDR